MNVGAPKMNADADRVFRQARGKISKPSQRERVARAWRSAEAETSVAIQTV